MGEKNFDDCKMYPMNITGKPANYKHDVNFIRLLAKAINKKHKK